MIDPWGIASMASATPQVFGSDAFPIDRSDAGTPNEGPAIRRVTLRSVWPDLAGTGILTNAATYRAFEEMARNVFVAHDDTVWDKSTDPDGPALQPLGDR